MLSRLSRCQPSATQPDLARLSEQVRGGVLERRALALQIGPGVVVNADGVHAGIPRGFPINDGDWGLF